MFKVFISIFICFFWSSVFAAEKNQNVPFELVNNMNQWFKKTRPGESIEMAGGKMTRTSDGARFIDKLGVVTLIPAKNPDYKKIADKNPNLASYWAQKYGLKNGPDKSVNIPVDTEVHLKLFHQYENQGAQIRMKFLMTKNEIQEKIKGEIDCEKTANNQKASPELRQKCQELIQLAQAHAKTMDYSNRLKVLIDASGNGKIQISPSSRTFQANYSPIINSVSSNNSQFYVPDTTLQTEFHVAQLNRNNIDDLIDGMSMDQLLRVWTALQDARMNLPPNDRFFELKSLLEDHVIPLYQAHQGIDVVSLRAQAKSKAASNVTGHDPLTPRVLAMIEKIRDQKK